MHFFQAKVIREAFKDIQKARRTIDEEMVGKGNIFLLFFKNIDFSFGFLSY